MSRLSIVLALGAGGYAAILFAETVDFTSAEPGSLPPHWLGTQTFDVEDNTFNDAGKVGVWTKADSVTLFNDFSYGSTN